MTLRLYSYKKKKLKYGTLKKLDQYNYNLLIQVQLTYKYNLLIHCVPSQFCLQIH